MDTHHLLSSLFTAFTVISIGGALPACAETSSGTDGDRQEADITSARCEFPASDGARDGHVEVFRCIGKPAGGKAFDMLRVHYSGSSAPEADEVYVRLNGKDGVFPMECRTDVSGSNGASTACYLTLRNLNLDTLDDRGTKVTAPALFELTRRDAAQIVDAWDIELAFRSGSRWDSLDGRNYRLRLDEKHP